MSEHNLTKTIFEQECIGDSLDKINDNFSELDTAAQTLSGIVLELSARVIALENA